LNPWDVAAGWLLVEEAGGRLSNFKNQPYNLEKPQETLASNGFIHKSMVRLFRKP
jgi:myo-inositol-1(or 4)-monophosphatase